MARIRLYTQGLNPYSQKVAIALDLKGLPFERLVSEDPEEIKRWSPVTHQLPVLEVEGKRRADSNEILGWLDELFPEPPLVSGDPKTADAQRRLSEWSDESFLFYWNRWRAVRFPRPGDEQPVDPDLLSKLRRHIDRSFGRAHDQPTRVELRELEVLDELAKRLDDLVGMLGRRPFFLSDQPSVADAAVFGMLIIIRDGPMMNGDEMVARRPSLSAFTERMEKLTPSLSSDPLWANAP